MIVLAAFVVVMLAAVGYNHFTSILPLTTLCHALVTNDFPTAYQQLSSINQQIVSEPNFEIDFYRVSSCQPGTSTAWLGDRATALLIMTNDCVRNYAQHVSLERSPTGDWKISGITYPTCY
jgi:hypothetical protein